MKKVIFISANVAVFEEISNELKESFVFVLAESVEKAVSLLLGEEGKSFEASIWDHKTVPLSNKLGDIMFNDDNDYDLNISRCLDCPYGIESSRVIEKMRHW